MRKLLLYRKKNYHSDEEFPFFTIALPFQKNSDTLIAKPCRISASDEMTAVILICLYPQLIRIRLVCWITKL